MLLAAQIENTAAPQTELNTRFDHQRQVNKGQALCQVEILLVISVKEAQRIDA